MTPSIPRNVIGSTYRIAEGLVVGPVEYACGMFA